MNIALFGWVAAALLVYMVAAFAVAYKRKRLDTVDIAWGGAYLVAASLIAGLEPKPATYVVLALVLVWSIRLVNHLASRILGSDHDDPRYSKIAAGWPQKLYWLKAFTNIFLLQGLLAFLVGLPIIFAAGEPLSFAAPVIVIGVIVWLVGFVIETVADHQMKVFKSKPKNKGKVLQTGLWSRSRHPNYLGEITQWYGIGIVACSAAFGWIGLLGPLLLNMLIRFISGVPPIERRKKDDPSYQQYSKKTWPILPKPL